MPDPTVIVLRFETSDYEYLVQSPIPQPDGFMTSNADEVLEAVDGNTDPVFVIRLNMDTPCDVVGVVEATDEGYHCSTFARASGDLNPVDEYDPSKTLCVVLESTALQMETHLAECEDCNKKVVSAEPLIETRSYSDVARIVCPQCGEDVWADQGRGVPPSMEVLGRLQSEHKKVCPKQ